jgi:hypothetical protein
VADRVLDTVASAILAGTTLLDKTHPSGVRFHNFATEAGEFYKQHKANA